MKSDKYDGKDILLETIRQRAGEKMTELGIGIDAKNFNTYVREWNIACEELSREFMQNGLVTSAKVALNWRSDYIYK